MQLSYARQADRIWILNVGDLKPLEIPINHFLDMAYDTPSWGYDSVPTWLNLWATREFGSELASKIASIVDRYGMYSSRRKYELLDPSFYSIINYSEGDAVLAQWAQLATDAQAVYDALGSEYRAAFYEMILQPVLGGEVVNSIYINAAKNSQYTEQKRNTANTVAQKVLDEFKQDASLTKRYHQLLGGKWNHILDRRHILFPTHENMILMKIETHLGYQGYWQQPMRNTLPALSYVQELETSLAGNIGIGVEASNATVPGDDAYHANSGSTLVLPVMDPYGPKTRWIDVFARGIAGCSWAVSSNASYVALTPSSGYTGGDNGTDTRIYVSVNWEAAPSAPYSSTITITVTSGCGASWGNYGAPTVQLPISIPSAPSSFEGFVESDKHISIEPEHISRSTSVNGVSYTTLPSYGRTLSGVTMLPVLADTQPAGTGPVLEYDIYTLTNTSVANVTLFISPSLNQNGASRPLRYAIAIDNEALQTIQFAPNITSGYTPPGWGGAVSDGVWGGVASGQTTTTKHNLSVIGEHTIKIWCIEPGVVIQKIIVDLGGVRESYLGPPESFRAGVDSVGNYDGTNFAGIQVSDVI